MHLGLLDLLVEPLDVLGYARLARPDGRRRVEGSSSDRGEQLGERRRRRRSIVGHGAPELVVALSTRRSSAAGPRRDRSGRGATTLSSEETGKPELELVRPFTEPAQLQVP